MTYAVKDTNLAAFLIVSGCSMTGHTREGNMTIFEFEQEDRISGLVQAYYGLKATVNPLTFGNALRSIRTIIHSEKHNANNYVQQPGKAA